MSSEKAEVRASRFGDPKQTLFLVDISSFIFRAFFAIRGLKNSTGEPTNAVYGVATMLARVAQEASPGEGEGHLAVVYDSPPDSEVPSFRKEMYPEYKANRSEPPEDLLPQFGRVEELVQALEVPSFRMPGLEADDVIATLARRWCAASPKHHAVIVTGDKDLMQLVGGRTRIWDTMSDKIYGPDEVVEKFGVKPEQIRDYLALVGDSSDNIPGVPSVGPKTAADLLKAHHTLDGVLKAAEKGDIAGKKGETIREHKGDALLSAKLATVREDLDVETDPAKLRYRFHISPQCQDFLKQMDFHTLLKKWADVAEAAPAAPPAHARVESGKSAPDSKTFRTVNTEKSFQELLHALSRAPEFGFDLETTSLNPREAELVGISICHDPAFGVYIPVGHRGTSVEQLPLKHVMEKLRPFIEGARHKKVGQNLKYDWSVLIEQGFQPDGLGADTMIAGYLLDAEGRHNLETLASRYLGYSVMTYEEVCGKGPDALGFDQVPIDLATRYSAEDAWIAFRLWRKMQPELERQGLMEVFAKVDLPLVPVLTRMEAAGVCIDVPFLQKLSTEFSRDLRRIEERVGAFTNGPINLNSPKQLAHLLFDQLKLPPQSKTKTGYSTDASVLEALAPLHEVPKLLLEYREVAKLKGTYVDTLPGERDPKDGKIHAGFHQTVAATGRLSSSDPNLQNIPVRTERGRKIRRAFIPSEGNVFVSADYSQIELRLLAHMSGDPELVRSFREGEDVHRRTAAEIFGIAPEKVDDRQRGIAKAINFGLMYGKTAFGLAQELGISRKEAQETIDRYFTRYSGVKRFLDGLILEAKEKGYVHTLLGRKRNLPDISSRNPAMRGNAERMAMNTPIQGTAADLMKLAMIEIDQRLRDEKFESKLIIQVHDEVVLDCPKKEAARARKLITEVMEGAMKLSVPLTVNSAEGASWEDL